jgi:hypothetical protein
MILQEQLQLCGLMNTLDKLFMRVIMQQILGFIKSVWQAYIKLCRENLTEEEKSW